MWSQILLCILVGVAYAAYNNPAWDEQHLYVYQIEGRSFASLDQISNHYSGIVFKAQLEIQPISDENLAAKISDAYYANIHAQLDEGWETDIPESQAGYSKLPLTEQPFKIELNNGAVRNVIVSKDIKNWEANMIKSIVSQFQLDTRPQNKIDSTITILTGEESNTAVYKTMEETVTGVHETLYEIHPFPEYVLQSKPWIVPQKHLIEQGGEILEIVKNKNFTHSQQTPSYHAGLEGVPGYKPGNKIADFLSRTSVTQAVITGSWKKYTVQSSVTVENIVLSPTFGDDQKGSLRSKLNATLLRIEQPSNDQWDVSNPVEVGVVYSYNAPYATENHPRSSKVYDHSSDPDSAESSSNPNSGSSRYPPNSNVNNFASYIGEEEYWLQAKPDMNEAPPSPLLPFTVGYDGQSLKQQKNIQEIVRKLAQEIGKEFSQPEEILRQQTSGKFVVLTSLVRTMNSNEIQQVASQLHSPQGEPSPAWVVFRDAVALSGTGPALANIKEWIQSGILDGFEAAQVIAATADAARQPTEKYMDEFSEMIKDENIMSKQYLNESVLFSYTNLVYQVYVKRQDSNGKYPVHSYGSFRTSKGQIAVKEKVIPYLNTQLHKAISAADIQKIHVYIRALGNIGQQEILEGFEPYLEGQKKSSHFQRLLMITALDKLVKSNPKVARSVLYKVYQNPSESELIRIAAVYQLMRTEPSPAMLQRMASYTNVDASNYVNAAVKSVIISATKLEGPEHYNLRTAAQSAEPLLTSEDFGVQYSQGNLRSYVVQESQLAYEQYIQAFGGSDHAVPKGVKYTLQKLFGGVKQNVLNFQAVVSSVEDLLDVFNQQTKEYQHHLKQKQEVRPSPLSSEYVAELLNLQNEQREQLEGNLYLQAGAFQGFFSFDNITLNNLPNVIYRWEQKLAELNKYTYYKVIGAQESVLALPTVLGLPFVYSYDSPLLIRVEANVKANAEPNFSSQQQLQRPNSVEADFNIQAVVSGRVQTQLGIFTPFNHERYSAGYHKNFQVVVPLNGKLRLNLQKYQYQIEVQNPGSQNNVRLAHYSSWPYTSQSEIYTPKPELKIIRSQNPYRRNFVVGDKSAGVAVTIQITSDERVDVPSFIEKFRSHDLVSAVLGPWDEESIHYAHVDVAIDSSRSTTDKVVLRLGYQEHYQINDPAEQKPDPREPVSRIPDFPDDPVNRQKAFVDQLSAYLNESIVLVADATVEFEGQTRMKYFATAGAVKSDVESLGVFMGWFRKSDRQSQKVEGYIQAAVDFPNTNGLDLNYAMKMNPKSSNFIQVLLQNEGKQSRAEAHVELKKNHQRVQYLQQLEDYKECQQQMQEGNQQLPICAKLTAEANFLNEFSIKMKYKDIDDSIINATYKAYSQLRHVLYPRIEENIIDSQSNDRLEVEGQFAPDLQSFNFSISSEYGHAEARNVQVNPWAKQILVPHAVFHWRSRLEAQALKYDTYRLNCVVDQTMTSTFDNKTYPATIPSEWTVLLQYVPRRPSPIPNKPDLTVIEQLRQQIESYIILARASSQGSYQKEIRIEVQMPQTKGEVVVITMKPRQGRLPKVYVNEQEVAYDTESSSSFYNGYIKIYALPNNEVKMEVHSAFYVIFNSQTLKITAVNSKFRDASRGLCGTFTGEPETDFLTPENCIVQDPREFVESYQVQNAPAGRSSLQESECYQKTVVFANYISNQDKGVTSGTRRRTEGCTAHVNKYVETGGQICFALRKLPVCKNHCNAISYQTKNVDVHCMDQTPGSTLWRSRIDRGIMTDDFTLMQPTRQMPMEVPSACVP